MVAHYIAEFFADARNTVVDALRNAGVHWSDIPISTAVTAPLRVRDIFNVDEFTLSSLDHNTAKRPFTALEQRWRDLVG